MVGIGGVAQAERERDRERDQQRRAVEQPGQPGVDVLDRPEQEVEVMPSSPSMS